MWTRIFEILLCAFFFALGLYQLFLWRIEWKFYKGKNWDWSIDTKESNTMFSGGPGISGTKKKPMSNRERVTFGYPAVAFVFIFASCMGFIVILNCGDRVFN
jgi:hypothetical protein